MQSVSSRNKSVDKYNLWKSLRFICNIVIWKKSTFYNYFTFNLRTK